MGLTGITKPPKVFRAANAWLDDDEELDAEFGGISQSATTNNSQIVSSGALFTEDERPSDVNDFGDQYDQSNSVGGFTDLEVGMPVPATVEEVNFGTPSVGSAATPQTAPSVPPLNDDGTIDAFVEPKISRPPVISLAGRKAPPVPKQGMRTLSAFSPSSSSRVQKPSAKIPKPPKASSPTPKAAAPAPASLPKPPAVRKASPPPSNRASSPPRRPSPTKQTSPASKQTEKQPPHTPGGGGGGGGGGDKVPKATTKPTSPARTSRKAATKKAADPEINPSQLLVDDGADEKKSTKKSAAKDKKDKKKPRGRPPLNSPDKRDAKTKEADKARLLKKLGLIDTNKQVKRRKEESEFKAAASFPKEIRSGMATTAIRISQTIRWIVDSPLSAYLTQSDFSSLLSLTSHTSILSKVLSVTDTKGIEYPPEAAAFIEVCKSLSGSTSN